MRAGANNLRWREGITSATSWRSPAMSSMLLVLLALMVLLWGFLFGLASSSFALSTSETRLSAGVPQSSRVVGAGETSQSAYLGGLAVMLTVSPGLAGANDLSLMYFNTGTQPRIHGSSCSR